MVNTLELHYGPKDLAKALYRSILRKNPAQSLGGRAIDATLLGLALGLLIQTDIWIRILLGVLAFAWYLAGYQFLRKAWLLYRLENYSRRAMRGKSEEFSVLTLEETGLRTVQNDQEVFRHFDEIQEMYEYPDVVDVLWTDGGALVLQRKSFGSDHHYDSWLTALEKATGKKMTPILENRL